MHAAHIQYQWFNAFKPTRSGVCPKYIYERKYTFEWKEDFFLLSRTQNLSKRRRKEVYIAFFLLYLRIVDAICCGNDCTGKHIIVHRGETTTNRYKCVTNVVLAYIYIYIYDGEQANVVQGLGCWSITHHEIAGWLRYRWASERAIEKYKLEWNSNVEAGVISH